MRKITALLIGLVFMAGMAMPAGNISAFGDTTTGSAITTTGGAIIPDPVPTPVPVPVPVPEPTPVPTPVPIPVPEPVPTPTPLPIPVPEPGPVIPDPMPGPVTPVVSYIVASPHNSTIEVNRSQDYHVTAYYTDGSTKDVSGDAVVSAADSTVAQVHNGTTMVYGVGPGTTTVIVRYQSFSDTSSLTVLGPVGKATLAVTPHGAQTIKIGGGVAFKATLNSTWNPPTQDVTNTSSWDYDASIVTMTYPGYFVGKGLGETIVTVTYTDSSGNPYTDSVEVDVIGNAPVAQRIEVRPGTNSGYLGQSITYVAMLRYSDGSSTDITSQCTWAPRNQNIATYTGGGKFRLNNTGTTWIDAFYNSSNGTLQDSSKLTVYANNYDTLSISPANQSASVGNTVYYRATLVHNDGRASEDITNSVTWRTSDNSIARAQSNGGFAAIGAGTATISATYYSGGNLYSSANLTVNAAPLPPTPSAPQNSTFTIGSTVYYIDGVPKYAPLAPYSYNNRTYVPLRPMAAAIGVNVGWNNATQTATFVDPETGTVVALTANNPYYSVNGILQPRMDVSPRLVGGSLTCPARYLAQAFGYQVGFNSATNTIVLSRAY